MNTLTVSVPSFKKTILEISVCSFGLSSRKDVYDCQYQQSVEKYPLLEIGFPQRSPNRPIPSLLHPSLSPDLNQVHPSIFFCFSARGIKPVENNNCVIKFIAFLFSYFLKLLSFEGSLTVIDGSACDSSSFAVCQ